MQPAQLAGLLGKLRVSLAIAAQACEAITVALDDTRPAAPPSPRLSDHWSTTPDPFVPMSPETPTKLDALPRLLEGPLEALRRSPAVTHQASAMAPQEVPNDSKWPPVAQRPEGYVGCLLPAVREVVVDGDAAIEVELIGAHGRGHTMLLDPDVWDEARRLHGEFWTRERDQDGQWHVAGMGSRYRKMVRVAACDIPEGGAVRHLNGRVEDCRRSNLAVVSVADGRGA